MKPEIEKFDFLRVHQYLKLEFVCNLVLVIWYFPINYIKLFLKYYYFLSLLIAP